MRVSKYLVFLLVAMAFLSPAPQAAELTGKPRVVDANTLEIGGTRVRLGGIVLPDEQQTCQNGGKAWNCGQEALFALIFELAEHWLTCRGRDIDPAGRLVAVCFTGPYELNATLVRKGWARAEHATSVYGKLQQAAQREGVGLWRTAQARGW